MNVANQTKLMQAAQVTTALELLRLFSWQRRMGKPFPSTDQIMSLFEEIYGIMVNVYPELKHFDDGASLKTVQDAIMYKLHLSTWEMRGGEYTVKARGYIRDAIEMLEDVVYQAYEVINFKSSLE